MDRTRHISAASREKLGNSCALRTMPPAFAWGLRSEGVHVPGLKSKVSTWLGAPYMFTKMQDWAVERSSGLVETTWASPRRAMAESAARPPNPDKSWRRVGVCGIKISRFAITVLV